MKDLGFLVVHCAKVPACGWFHGKEGDDLEEMILDHIAQAARGFVKRPALPHAETLRECDLNTRNVVAVPDRLKE